VKSLKDLAVIVVRACSHSVTRYGACLHLGSQGSQSILSVWFQNMCSSRSGVESECARSRLLMKAINVSLGDAVAIGMQNAPNKCRAFMEKLGEATSPIGSEAACQPHFVWPNDTFMVLHACLVSMC